MNYCYGMRLRGFSVGCQPMNGLIDRVDDKENKYHDILVYNRELTSEEIKDYELDFINIPEPEHGKSKLKNFAVSYKIENAAQIAGTEPRGESFNYPLYIPDYIEASDAEEAKSYGASFINEQCLMNGKNAELDDNENTVTVYEDGDPVERYTIVSAEARN